MVDGCPRCGCNDVEFRQEVERAVVRGGERRAYRVAFWHCNWCYATFSQPVAPVPNEDSRVPVPVVEHHEVEISQPLEEPQAVTFHLIRCPGCMSTNTRIYKTDRPIRYHKCSQCGLSFKSVEAEATL